MIEVKGTNWEKIPLVVLDSKVIITASGEDVEASNLMLEKTLISAPSVAAVVSKMPLEAASKPQSKSSVCV